MSSTLSAQKAHTLRFGMYFGLADLLIGLLGALTILLTLH
jgi:hypothetical protein